MLLFYLRKTKKDKKRKPKVIIKFEPSSNFDKEFVEFVEEVLAWSKNKQKSKENDLNKSTVNNPPP